MAQVTFVSYLLNESEAEISAKMSAIHSHIKTIINNFLTSVADDEDELNHRMLMGREVFDTLKEVGEDRLSGEQVELSRGRQSKGGYEEWKDDAKQNYARLWQSIEDEMNDAVEEVLTPPRGPEERDARPATGAAVRHFKNHVVGPFVDLLQQYKPEEAKEHFGPLLDQMESEWNNYARQAHPDDAQVARNMLMQHQRERNRRLSQRKRRSTRKERKSIRDVAIEKGRAQSGGRRNFD